ncbi:MAG: hypothetical protein ABW321_17295 [Polyangiales bacterium]
MAIHWQRHGLRASCTGLVLALCSFALPVNAHAPLPRAVAASPHGGALALALPGFGLLVRPHAEARFAYTCDAALGVPPSDRAATLRYFDDGTLLVGSPGGLRHVAADGCQLPRRHAVLGSEPISALAIHPATQLTYAIAAGRGAGIWRSSDHGMGWEQRGPCPDPALVTGLVIDPEDNTQLFVSVAGATPEAGATLHVSRDGGTSFSAHPQTRALQLLAAQAAPARLWAVARALDSRGNRGFDVMYTSDVDGEWHSALRVNYFGGLTITPSGEIWVGDEGGGIYRSRDAGRSFDNLDARSRVACLASEADAVWACTPALPMAPALQVLRETGPMTPALAFGDVESLVSCDDQDIATQCQAAWAEWQRDVLMQQDPAAVDAGAPELPSAMPLDDARDDAGTPPPSATPENVPPATGCHVMAARSGSSTPWLVLLVLLGWRRRRLAAHA